MFPLSLLSITLAFAAFLRPSLASIEVRSAPSPVSYKCLLSAARLLVCACARCSSGKNSGRSYPSYVAGFSLFASSLVCVSFPRGLSAVGSALSLSRFVVAVVCFFCGDRCSCFTATRLRLVVDDEKYIYTF